MVFDGQGPLVKRWNGFNGSNRSSVEVVEVVEVVKVVEVVDKYGDDPNDMVAVVTTICSQA